MGKKGGWISKVRKALRPSDSEKKKDKKSHKSSSKISCFGKRKRFDTDSCQTSPRYGPVEEKKHTQPENEPIKQAYSTAYAATMAAEAAAEAAHAAVEVLRVTPTTRFRGKSKEEIATIKIQMAYRGYLARKVFSGLRRLGRLKLLIQGQSVKRQSRTTLRSLQTLARVQSQVRARRIRMSEENQALQRQLLQKHEKEINNIKSSMKSDWDGRTKSKEEIEASLQSKKEAAARREKALAYAYSRQQTWRNSSKSDNPTFVDPNIPQWGWSWLERWTAVRPWEAQIPTDTKSVGDMGCQSPSTPPAKRVASGGRLRSISSNGSVSDDSKSLYSVQSELYTSSSVRDNESLASSPTARSYMGSTKSPKAGSRRSNPGPSPLGSTKKGTPGTGLVEGSAKKQLSFTGSPSSDVRKSLGPLRTKSNLGR